MKSIYITSVERYSGKTAVCLALGKRLIVDGFKVGYLKPLSLQPWRLEGQIIDEDAAFAKEVLNISAPARELSPVVVTAEFLRSHLRGAEDINLLAQVLIAYEKARKDQDLLLLEGGASLREGYVVGLPTPLVAETLDSRVLVIVKYRDEVRVLDDALAAQARLGSTLGGAIINRVPEEAGTFVRELVKPFLEGKGISIFGVLPEVRSLAAITVEELVQVLSGEVLTEGGDRSALVEHLTVGAMTAEAALSRFRKQTNKAVITGGDRTDIQLAALETSTACLILTGNLHPSPLIVKQAEDFGVTVVLVRWNTMETIEKIEQVFGKTRLGQATKLEKFEDLIANHVNIDRLYKVFSLRE